MIKGWSYSRRSFKGSPHLMQIHVNTAGMIYYKSYRIIGGIITDDDGNNKGTEKRGDIRRFWCI